MTTLHRDTEHLLTLAERCEKAAVDLDYEADNAAEVLTTRAGGDRMDPDQWAADKRSAASAARNYAAGIRAEAEAADPYLRPSAERLAQAEKVARGAEMGGILVDGRRLAEASAEGAWDQQGRDAILAGYQADRDAVEGSGQFTHVAETIDGVEQVPYWQLGNPAQQTASSEPVDEP